MRTDVRRIVVVGGGVMGGTLAGGFVRRDPRPDVTVVEKNAERAAQLRAELGVEVVDLADAGDALASADVVVLVVKPQDVPALLADAGSRLRPGALVVSIAAGITTATIEAAVPAGVPVVRAMPNTPARIDLGVTGISPGSSCPPEMVAVARELMSTVGVVVEVPEELQDAVTAVSGSGPAYVFYLAEAMAAAGVELGLDEDTAALMAARTVLGAASLLVASGEPAAELRRQVTSPGGTTAAAIGTLDRLGAAEALRAAITAARDRGRELSGG